MTSTIPLHTVSPRLTVPLEEALSDNGEARTCFDKGDERGALASLQAHQSTLTDLADGVAAKIALLEKERETFEVLAARAGRGATILSVLLPDRPQYTTD